MRVKIKREETRKEFKEYYIDLPDGLTSNERANLIENTIYRLEVNNIVNTHGKVTDGYMDYDCDYDRNDDKFEDDDYDEADGSDGKTVVFTLNKKGKILNWRKINY